MLLLAHVDEVVDDHAPQIAQAQLAGDLAGRQQVHLVGGLLGRVVGAEVAAVDVDGHQRLGLIDDDRAALPQRHLALMDQGDFAIEVIFVEQRLARLRKAASG